MYSQRYTRKCNRGPSCYFKARGQCWFDHSEDDHSSRRIPTRSNYSFYNHQDEDDDDDYSGFSYTRPRRTQNTSSYLNTITRSSTTDSFQRLLQMILNLRKIQEPVRQIKKVVPPKVQVGVQKSKKLTLNGKQVDQIEINTSLNSTKAWFFKNSNHFKFFNDCGYQQCSICLQKFNRGQQVSLLLCKHSFHHKCIEQWLNSSNNCPLCRHDFRTHQEFKKFKGYTKPLTLSTSLSMDRIPTRSVFINQYEDQQQFSF